RRRARRLRRRGPHHLVGRHQGLLPGRHPHRGRTDRQPGHHQGRQPHAPLRPGDMLADSMKWYLEDAGLGGEHEVIGFMNPGGIRAELWYDESTTGEGDGVVTYAEANS